MLRDLFALTVEASTYQWSGKLAVANPVAGLAWQLFFEMGRLVWVDGGTHPRRRYRRYLKRLGIAPSLAECATPEARLQLAIAAIRDRRIDPQGLQSFLQGSAREIFFDISQACSGSLKRADHGRFDWQKNVRPSQEFIVPSSWGIDACLAFKNGRRDWRQWGEMQFGYRSPDLAPVIVSAARLSKLLAPKALERALRLFAGDRSLRDIALRTKQHPYEVASSLQAFLQKGCLTLKACPDYGATRIPTALDYLSTNGLEIDAIAPEEEEAAPTLEARETHETAEPAIELGIPEEVEAATLPSAPAGEEIGELVEARSLVATGLTPQAIADRPTLPHSYELSAARPAPQPAADKPDRSLDDDADADAIADRPTLPFSYEVSTVDLASVVHA